MNRLFPDHDTPAAPMQVIGVSDLNARARALLEAGIPPGWVAGEISNFTRAASGHCYFSLKDADAQVRCVLFRHRAAQVDAVLANGQRVEVRATVTLYEARGDFQLNVDAVRRAGVGSLFEAFERLKRKLEAEGLFAAERKRPLPPLPAAVGVVTSPQAAALRDVLATLRKRLPTVRVVIYPTPVQGEGAAQRIAAAIATASQRSEVDVLLVCRGGGSAEDLWSFNDEAVARAIAASAVPVVTGVGHETDFTIADFVADLRAPTPTAAAAAVVPDRNALQRRVEAQAHALRRGMARQIDRRAQQLDHLAPRIRHPGERIALRREALAHMAARLRAGWQRAEAQAGRRMAERRMALNGARPDLERLTRRLAELEARRARGLAGRMEAWRLALAGIESNLRHLDPGAVLERGYAIVRDGEGTIVREAMHLRVGAEVSLTLARGSASATVTGTRRD